MAEIYTKSTIAGNEKCVILDYREGLRFPFKIEDWTRIKVALVWSYTASASNNELDGYGLPSITPNSEKDRMYFGLKRYSLGFPGPDSGEYFLGLRSYGSASTIAFGQSIFNPTNAHGETLTYGVQHPDESREGTDTSIFNVTGPGSFDDTSLFAGIVCLDLTILNKGLSNQQVTFKFAKQVISDTSRANIESVLNTATYTNAGNLNLNFNGVPYDLPDSFFMYIPYTNLRLRVFGLQVIRLG